jgi:hypothetical protein
LFRFGVRTSDSRLDRYLEAVLSPLVVAGPAAHWYSVTATGVGEFEIRLDGVRVVGAPDARWAAAWLLWHVNRAVVEASPQHLLLHAGCVVAGGSGIVLPGAPGSGKSTVTAALVRHGMGYLSDELAALAGDATTVLPYPKALALEPPSIAALHGGDESFIALWSAPEPGGSPWSAIGKSHVVPDRIRPGASAGPSPARLVVVPHYRPRGDAALHPLTASEGLIELVTNTVNLERHGGRGVSLLADLAERCACYRLEYSDVEEACSIVGREVDRFEAEPVAG